MSTDTLREAWLSGAAIAADYVLHDPSFINPLAHLGGAELAAAQAGRAWVHEHLFGYGSDWLAVCQRMTDMQHPAMVDAADTYALLAAAQRPRSKRPRGKQLDLRYSEVAA